jgi:hypothetical protein
MLRAKIPCGPWTRYEQNSTTTPLSRCAPRRAQGRGSSRGKKGGEHERFRVPFALRSHGPLTPVTRCRGTTQPAAPIPLVLELDTASSSSCGTDSNDEQPHPLRDDVSRHETRGPYSEPGRERLIRRRSAPEKHESWLPGWFEVSTRTTP